LGAFRAPGLPTSATCGTMWPAWAAGPRGHHGTPPLGRWTPWHPGRTASQPWA